MEEALTSWSEAEGEDKWRMRASTEVSWEGMGKAGGQATRG